MGRTEGWAFKRSVEILVRFAVPERKVAIERDGHEFPKTKQQRTRDAQRDRFVSEEGWTILRFTGSEVFQDADECIKQVKRIVER